MNITEQIKLYEDKIKKIDEKLSILNEKLHTTQNQKGDEIINEHKIERIKKGIFEEFIKNLKELKNDILNLTLEKKVK